MGLHKLHRQAQWQALTDSQRTPLQRLAARTHGIVTPANGISLLGLLLTVAGLMLFFGRQHIWGIALVGIGRFCDILDGHIARKTRTSSPLGEALDAIFDKVVVIAACVLLVKAGVIPLLLGVLLLGFQLIIAGIAVVARHDHTDLHPGRTGKYAMFGLWVVVGLFMLAHALPQNGWAQVTWITAFILVMAVLVAEAQALREYIRAFVRRHLTRR